MQISQLVALAFALCLIGSTPAGAWESNIPSLPRASKTAVKIDPVDKTVIYEVQGIIGAGSSGVQAVATNLGGTSPVTLPVTRVDSVGHPGGVTTYFTLDATPICDGLDRILTATFVDGNGLTQSAASRYVICSP